jgi:hypothetical protein
MEVKVSRDTKVVIGLSETEATKLKGLLIAAVSFEDEGWARELYVALDDNEVSEVAYVLDSDSGTFVRDGA